MLSDAAPMLIVPGGAPAITSAVKWARAGTSWAISADGYTATRTGGSTTTDSEAVAGTFRSQGLAAFTMILDPGTAPSGSSAIGLYPSGALISAGAFQANSVTWASNGLVRVGSTIRSGSTRSWAIGDEVGFLLSSAGTRVQLIHNGVVLGEDFDAVIAKVSRSPGFASQNGGTQRVLLNGKPDGFPAWDL